jgi:hypothetical protein
VTVGGRGPRSRVAQARRVQAPRTRPDLRNRTQHAAVRCTACVLELPMLMISQRDHNSSGRPMRQQRYVQLHLHPVAPRFVPSG